MTEKNDKAERKAATRKRWLADQEAKAKAGRERIGQENIRHAAQRQQRPTARGRPPRLLEVADSEEEATRAHEKQVEADELLEAERYKSSPFRFGVVDPDVPIRHNFQLVEENIIVAGLIVVLGQCRRCGEEWLFTTKAWTTTVALGPGPCPEEG